MSKPNILLIVIDALRARNLGCYGYEKPTSPIIDALSRESAVFEHCFSTINVTDPSFTTILSGMYPATHGMVEQAITSPDIYLKKLSGLLLIQDILRKNGYTTIGVDWLGRWHKQGFDYYSGAINQKLKLFNNMVFEQIKKNAAIAKAIELIKKSTNRGIFSPLYATLDNATSVTDCAINMLEKFSEQNWFLFIHYWDTHIPYNPPPEHLRQFPYESYDPGVDSISEVLSGLIDPDWKYFIKKYTGKMKSTKEVLARYDGSIHYVDSEIGRLLKKLKNIGLLDNTIVIITADHGESLTEHGIYFDHHGLYDELIHVPLIFYYPVKIPARRVGSIIQHVELVPTILDLAGIDYSSYDLDGYSLVNYLGREQKAQDLRPFIYAEEARSQRKYAIRTKKFKCIFALSEAEATCNYCGRIHGGIEELYDLEKDPGENHNIANEQPEAVAELKETSVKFRRELENKRQKEQLKEKIRNLKAEGKV